MTPAPRGSSGKINDFLYNYRIAKRRTHEIGERQSMSELCTFPEFIFYTASPRFHAK